ncbi:hypothetical protein PEL8287_01204 [Roseovarius litorisediminis]|uniref:Uncharacterized protein n=1 Tax=Roseovarius litorisediminis TaxID=1312363 RepID=A0A1Y5RYS6_9RHOB|nr:hypothetical protein PEL8287_01204 [Roseovarius litorisediminis]
MIQVPEQEETFPRIMWITLVITFREPFFFVVFGRVL